VLGDYSGWTASETLRSSTAYDDTADGRGRFFQPQFGFKGVIELMGWDQGQGRTFGGKVMMVSYHGVYINLDRSLDRRQKIEKQLADYNLTEKYARLPAIDGAPLESSQGTITPSEAACFQSHYRALERAKAHGTCVHILEDDAILSQFVPSVIDRMQSSGNLDQFDIVFTETLVPLNPLILIQCMRQFEELSPAAEPRFTIFNISALYNSGTSSYVVGAHAIDRVLAAYYRGLEAGPDLPLDIFIRQEARASKLRLGCIFPFITTVPLMEDADSTLDVVRFNRSYKLLRYSFFVNCDLDIVKPLLEKIQEAKSKRPRDRRHDLLCAVLELAMLDLAPPTARKETDRGC
jgi:GR25 family glycosyltransferase involved in LPS biosynthesis